MLSGGGGGGGQDRLLRPPTNTITTPIPARPGSPPQSQTQTHTHTHTHIHLGTRFHWDIRSVYACYCKAFIEVSSQQTSLP